MTVSWPQSEDAWRYEMKLNVGLLSWAPLAHRRRAHDSRANCFLKVFSQLSNDVCDWMIRKSVLVYIVSIYIRLVPRI